MELSEDLRLIHQPVRLRIMGLLYKHRDVAFTRARDSLGLTDGNLASHANRLEEVGLLESRKALTRDGFEARYRITQQGDRRFRDYLETLEGFMADHGAAGEPQAGPTVADSKTNVQG